MKKFGMALAALLFAAAVILSFFAGEHRSEQKHAEERAERCGRSISFAMDTIRDKGLAVEGAPEAAASHIWAAHELCDDPELSAELSEFWNLLVYDRETWLDREEELTAKLAALLERCG